MKLKNTEIVLMQDKKGNREFVVRAFNPDGSVNSEMEGFLSRSEAVHYALTWLGENSSDF